MDIRHYRFTAVQQAAFTPTNVCGQIDAFNQAVLAGKPPETDQQSFEAKFATALYLAKKERYKESILLFTALMPIAADNNQKSAVQYNIGNISFLRGLAING